MNSILIGRSNECDIRITGDQTVSGVHCRISRVGNQYVFENLGRNGSTINGTQITGRVVIQPGSRVQIGARTMLPWSEVKRLIPLEEIVVHPGNPDDDKGKGGAGQNTFPPTPSEDRFNFGWWILSFFIWPAGFILFIVWRNRYPNRAKTCCLIPAIIGAGIDLTFGFLSAL